MTALDTTTPNQIPAVSLEERRDTLAARLDAGFDKIEDARKQGTDITRWEQGWLRLLQEYEEICDQIARRPASHAS